MYASVRREIPEFLSNEVVYCDNLCWKRNKKSCLLLTKQLSFYEFQQKQLSHCIDLNNSCLKKVARELFAYKGPRGKWYESNKQVETKDTNLPERAGLLETAELSLLEQTQTQWLQMAKDAPEICFGKYVYSNFDISKLYFLIRCWDKLVVLERRDNSQGFLIVAEHEQVLGYRLVHGARKFHAVVEIRFQNNATMHTDFQDDTSPKCNSAVEPPQHKKDFKQLLERVRNVKAELTLHQEITQREYRQLSETQSFGCNMLRSLRLEEKQMLTRCGDVWSRFVADVLVIGVPLVNNCARPNLTILRHIKPLLKICNEQENEIPGLTLHYRLYQLSQQFADLETLETFFQTEDVAEQTSACAWNDCEPAHMLPEAFAVLLLKLEISQIIALQNCALFLSFEVEKQMPAAEKRTFTQQIFIKQLHFGDILSAQKLYAISFDAAKLHQDLLATAFTAEETLLGINFKTHRDQQVFERLLIDKFELKLQARKLKTSQLDDVMDIDDDEAPATNSTLPLKLFYNMHAASMWHGLVCVKQAANDNGTANELHTFWKFYTKNVQMAYLLLKLLFSDMILHKCNVESVEYDCHRKAPIAAIELESALREELQALLKFSGCKTNGKDKLQQIESLVKLQMKTDLLATGIIK